MNTTGSGTQESTVPEPTVVPEPKIVRRDWIRCSKCGKAGHNVRTCTLKHTRTMPSRLIQELIKRKADIMGILSTAKKPHAMEKELLGAVQILDHVLVSASELSNNGLATAFDLRA